MRRYQVIAWAALAWIVVGAAPASAGWVIDQVTGGGGRGGRMQVLIQANRMKNVVLGTDGQPAMAFIVDLDAETITQVDYRGQRYMTATIQQYEQMMGAARLAASGQMAGAIEQMQGVLKDMPPERRQKLEQIMRSRMGQAGQAAQECQEPRIEARRTDQQANIAGYPAVRFDLLAEGRPDSEVWIAPGITAWKEMDPQKLERFAAEMGKLAGCGAGRGGGFGADLSLKLAGEGYPVRSVHLASGATVEVVKAESRAIPAAEFQPPTGFTPQTLQRLLGQ
ncbi:MAG TPA: hypothetical protein VED18_07615 [Candidatus Sulfotelmatobacter sp.]|nr:hypothetical protein [Candidatus Sulfotelmatobacter sp.]